MALHDLESYLFRLKNDPAMQAALQQNPGGHLRAQPGLDEAERAALLAQDVESLWRMGVHPLLLAPLSRFFGLSAAEYIGRLQPLSGLRRFTS